MLAREDAPNEEEAIDLEISSTVTVSDALSPRSVQSRTLQLNSEIGPILTVRWLVTLWTS